MRGSLYAVSIRNFLAALLTRRRRKSLLKYIFSITPSLVTLRVVVTQFSRTAHSRSYAHFSRLRDHVAWQCINLPKIQISSFWKDLSLASLPKHHYNRSRKQPFLSTVCAKNIALQLWLKKVEFFLRSIFLKICMQVPILSYFIFIKSKKSPRRTVHEIGTCALY